MSSPANEPSAVVRSLTGDFLDAFDHLLKVPSQSAEMTDLVLEILESAVKGGTVLDMAVGMLSDHGLEVVATAACQQFRNSLEEKRTAASIVTGVATQAPQLLAEHLSALFEAGWDEQRFYQARWPWRGADEGEIARLDGLCRDGTLPNSLRERALLCLLQTRRQDVLLGLIEYWDLLLVSRPDLDPGTFFRQIGLESTNRQLRSLDPKFVAHIVFPSSFFEDDSRPRWRSRELHPTWNLSSRDSIAIDFGGAIDATCSRCDDKLHRLFGGAIPSSLGVESIDSLTLATCLSCLGWEEPTLFCKHDEVGTPTAWPVATTGEPRFPAEPLRSVTATLVPTPQRWASQDWESRENLNRLGGAPMWIQDAVYPECPRCDMKMPFLAQLDSDLPTASGREWMWGSGGVAYIHWCDACRVSGYHWQCT